MSYSFPAIKLPKVFPCVARATRDAFSCGGRVGFAHSFNHGVVLLCPNTPYKIGNFLVVRE